MQGGVGAACILAFLMFAGIAALNTSDSHVLNSTADTSEISNVFPDNATSPMSIPVDAATTERQKSEEPNEASDISGLSQRKNNENNATNADKESKRDEQNSIINRSLISVQLPRRAERRSGYEYSDGSDYKDNSANYGLWSSNQEERNELLNEAQAEVDALTQIIGNKPIKNINHDLSQSITERSHYTPEQFMFQKQSNALNINYGESPFTSPHSLRAYNINPIPVFVDNNAAYSRKNDVNKMKSFYNSGPSQENVNNGNTIYPVPQVTLNGKINDVKSSAVVDSNIIQANHDNQPEYILSQNQVDAVIQALNATSFPTKQITKVSDFEERQQFLSRVIPNSDLTYLINVPGAEKSIKCTVEGQFYHLTTPMGQCLVCICAAPLSERLQPVCANCNGCPTFPVTAEQQKGVDACAPLPVGVTFEHPLNPCHVCVCLVVEGGSAHISCQPGPQCVKQKEVIATPSGCHKFPNNVEFPHPSDNCQMCKCTGIQTTEQQDQMQCYSVTFCSRDQEPVTSTNPIALLEGSLNRTLTSSKPGTYTPTLVPPNDVYAPISSTPSAYFTPLLHEHTRPFTPIATVEPKLPYDQPQTGQDPFATLRPAAHLTTHTLSQPPSTPLKHFHDFVIQENGTRTTPSVIPQQPVTWPLNTVRPLSPEPFPSPPYQKNSSPFPPTQAKPYPFSYPITGRPNNGSFGPPYDEVPKAIVTKPLFPPQVSTGGLVTPNRGPLLGPPPHESCAPFPPGEDFDHPWDVCQVCRCIELHSQGHIYIEINCNTKSTCCVIPYAPELVSEAQSTLTQQTGNIQQIPQLQILDKSCELKTLEVEWAAPGAECRMCACRAFGSYVVPTCRGSTDYPCTGPTDKSVQIKYLAPLCRYQPPDRSFPNGCKTCMCQAVFDYVIVVCQPTPLCDNHWIENGVPATSSGATTLMTMAQNTLLGPAKTSQDIYPNQRQPPTPSVEEIRAIAEFLSLFRGKSRHASVAPLQNVQYNYHNPNAELQNAFSAQKPNEQLNYNQAQTLGNLYTQGQQYNKIQDYSMYSPQTAQQETGYPNVISNSYYGGSGYGSYGSFSPQIASYRPGIDTKYRTRSGNDEEQESSTKSPLLYADKNSFPFQEPTETATWYTITEAPTTHAYDETSAAFAQKLMEDGGKRGDNAA